MSDLSWLNPTPHTIAVYASRPLSPVAAQHSLPSGRYSLLGPDFHRLDRTSLRLAHSFDHLVGACEQLVWNCDAPPPAGVPSDGASERHQEAALLGGEAIEQPVAARAPQVGLATAAIGPARGMR